MTASPREVAELARQRLAATDMAGFTDLFAEDALFEYPFDTLGWPARIEGRDALRAHLAESRKGIRDLITVDNVAATVHDTGDPEVVIIELEVSGTNTATGEPFRFASGVGIMRVRDGKVVHYRDYTNALGAARITGRLSQLAASFA